MDDDTYRGAEAAAVYFLELDPYMQITGDTTEWEAMSSESCDTCSSRVDQARKLADGGYQWAGGMAKATILHTYRQDGPTGVWPIDVEVRTEAVTVTDSGGGVIFSEELTVNKSRVEVVDGPNGWLIVGIAALDGN
jgi:hypothetical protein